MNSFISRLFIPQESNNHKALLLHPSFLTLFIALYLLNQQFIQIFSQVKPGVLGYSSQITVEKVVELTNQARIKESLPPLKYNATLSESAQKKAQDMFANNYWAHTSPQGTTPWDFFKAVDYQYSIAGENLAKDFYDTDSVVKAWMKSPTHRDNILNQKYQEIGIAVQDGIIDGVKTTLVVQHFATPLNPTPLASGDTSSPQTNIAQVMGNQEVLAQEALVATKPFVSPHSLSKIFGIFLFIVILSVLLIDGYLTLKNETYRLSSSNAGHVAFLTIVFVLMLFSRSGSIF